MAVMLSTTSASKSGLMISGGDVIEKANDIGIVVFDKTGTLTIGKPSVISFHTNINEEEFLKISSSCTQFSNHPLSIAITEFGKEKNIKLLDPDKFKNIAGLGFEAQISNKKILVGSADLLRQHNIDFDLSDKVGSHVYVVIDNKYVGVFNIYDSVKPNAVELVANLKNIGVEIIMLTGDNELMAKAIASELGITRVYSNVKPVEKAQIIDELKLSGKKVAMVGDGINDAPALTAADLSLAMSSGSDIAIEASDVSVFEGKIEKVYDFFLLSRRTMTIIKQNLFLSFIYNFLCIPLAAGVFFYWWNITLTPMWASLAMGLSSASVILSSLRLKKSL
jgi:Cu+-exporting ATPase